MLCWKWHYVILFFFFKWQSSIPLNIAPHLLIHASVGGHLGFFYVLGILWTALLWTWELHLTSSTVLHCGCTTLHSHQVLKSSLLTTLSPSFVICRLSKDSSSNYLVRGSIYIVVWFLANILFHNWFKYNSLGLRFLPLGESETPLRIWQKLWLHHSEKYMYIQTFVSGIVGITYKNSQGGNGGIIHCFRILGKLQNWD